MRSTCCRTVLYGTPTWTACTTGLMATRPSTSAWPADCAAKTLADLSATSVAMLALWTHLELYELATLLMQVRGEMSERTFSFPSFALCELRVTQLAFQCFNFSSCLFSRLKGGKTSHETMPNGALCSPKRLLLLLLLLAALREAVGAIGFGSCLINRDVLLLLLVTYLSYSPSQVERFLLWYSLRWLPLDSALPNCPWRVVFFLECGG